MKRDIFFLVVLAYLYFFLGNGIFSLTSPDEVFYVQTAKEMVRHHSWGTAYLFGQPQFEKPIFLYWLLRIGFIILGENSFSARFFPALFAGIGIIGTYLLCMIGFGNRKKAFFCSLILLSSGLYIGLARTVFTDMIFSVWILLALVSFYWGWTGHKHKGAGIILFFIFAALAVLTKGPLGLIIPALIIIVFLWLERSFPRQGGVRACPRPEGEGMTSREKTLRLVRYLLSRYWLWGLFIFALISFPWYILMMKKYAGSFIQEFFYNDHIRRIFYAEHTENDRWYFYPSAMILNMAPWCLYTLAGLVYLMRNLKAYEILQNDKGAVSHSDSFYVFLFSWISVVFLIFQPAHSKLVSYIFPLFPALAILTGGFIYDAAVDGKNKKPLFYLSLATLVFLAIIAGGLIVVLFVSPNLVLTYLGSKLPLFILFSLLLFLMIGFSIFVIRSKFIQSSYVLMLFVGVFFSVIPLTHKTIEPYISSRDMCLYLLKNEILPPMKNRGQNDTGSDKGHRGQNDRPGKNSPTGQIDNVILCSKPFVRGVKYYTNREVAVMDIPGRRKFFSPHPIIFLDIDSLVLEFLRKQKITYCILKKSSLADIQRFPAELPHFDEEFRYEILIKIGNAYLVKIEPR